MRSRTTLILVLLALFAALFFFLVEEPRRARRTERTAIEERLTTIGAEDVHSVSIGRADVLIVAERRGGGWQLTTPVVDAADDPAVNMLVVTTCSAPVDRQFAVEESLLSEFGLAPPAATVRFAAMDGEDLLELRIGDFNPSKSHCYALGQHPREVLLLPAGVRRYALRPLFEFRNKRIVEVEVREVARLDISSARGSVTWTAGEGGPWFTVQDGDTVRGDRTEVEGVIRRLRCLRAKDIPFGPAPDPGDPLGTIRLSIREDSSVVSLAFSRPRRDACYVASSHTNRMALVDTTMVPIFAMTVDDFRNRRILAYSEDALARIVWETPQRSLTVIRTDGTWSYANPGFGRIDAEAASRLLSTLAGLEFTAALENDYTEIAGHGFDAPALRVTLLDTGDRVLDEVVVGSLLPDGVSRYVASRSSRTLATIDPEPLSRLEEELSNLGGP